MKRYLEKFVAFLAIWLVLMTLIAQVLMTIELRRWESVLDSYAQTVVSAVKNKLDANEAVLAGCAAFLLAVDKSDADSVARYAAAVLSAYPHIYMLEVARRVPLSEKAEFEALLRKNWRADFKIKDFSSLTPRSRLPELAMRETWPVLFMYPLLPEAGAIYGLSLETVDYLSYSMALAKGNPKPVVSPVFKMYEGGEAFILLQEVNRPDVPGIRGKPNFFGDVMVVLLLIKTETLLSAIGGADVEPYVQIAATIKSAAVPESPVFSKVALAEGRFESLLLPTLNRTLTVGNDAQPVTLNFVRQMRWSDLMTTDVIAVLGLYLFALIAVPVLALKHLRSLEEALSEHERSAYLATHDILTELPNRYLFADRFEQALRLWQRNGMSFALLLIDLDWFKQVNDTYGHEVGDQVLKACASRMVHQLRGCDTVARHGGDEFTVLLETVAGPDDALSVAEKLKMAISSPIETTAGTVNISCSIGVALCPEHGQTLDALRKAADKAMYGAKNSGRDIVCAYRHLHVV